MLVQPSAYPTNMYAAAQQPADEELAKSYGEIAEVPGKILKTFVTLFQGENAPNPQDVATAIDKIVSTPAGSRPDRVVVGLPFGSDAVNTAVAPIQRGVIESLGLGDLTKLKILNQSFVRLWTNLSFEPRRSRSTALWARRSIQISRSRKGHLR